LKDTAFPVVQLLPIFYFSSNLLADTFHESVDLVTLVILDRFRAVQEELLLDTESDQSGVRVRARWSWNCQLGSSNCEMKEFLSAAEASSKAILARNQSYEVILTIGNAFISCFLGNLRIKSGLIKLRLNLKLFRNLPQPMPHLLGMQQKSL
jgi:hypothetical protein